MKKRFVITLVILLVIVNLISAQNNTEKKEKITSDIITKTYELKNISPYLVDKVLGIYLIHSSYSGESNLFIAQLRLDKVETFEKMLKKLDVEKKKILLRVFTVIASKGGKSDPIQNNDLRIVLNELKKVLSFNSYKLDGISALSLVDGQSSSMLKLSSSQDLRLHLQKIRIQNTEEGRTVKFNFMITQKSSGGKYDTLIQSETSIEENGFLVAGVSKIGENGDSLVLVMNAEIE